MKRPKPAKLQGKAQKRPGQIPPPGPGNQITPEEYFEHWKANKVWTHLAKPRHQKRLRWCAERCEGESFADIGCMLGHSTSIMAGFRPGDWTGVDFAAAAIEKARKLFPDLKFLYYPDPDIMAWPLAGEFDTVVCSEVLEHVEDDEKFLRILASIATERLVLTTPSRDAQDPGHVRLYTPDSLEALLRPYEHYWTQDEDFYYIVIELK